jgi:hypothetical protein
LLARKPEFWVTALITYVYVDGNLGMEKYLQKRQINVK